MIVTRVIMVIVAAATAATDGGSPAAAASLQGSNLPDHNHLEGDLLQGELVAGTAEESHRPLGGFVDGAEFNPDLLAREVGEVVPQLPVEDERHVGVELLLKLPELAIAQIPGSRLEHGEYEHVIARVMGKGVEHPRPLDSRAGRGRVRAGQIFPEGNHT